MIHNHAETTGQLPTSLVTFIVAIVSLRISDRGTPNAPCGPADLVTAMWLRLTRIHADGSAGNVPWANSTGCWSAQQHKCSPHGSDTRTGLPMADQKFLGTERQDQLFPFERSSSGALEGLYHTCISLVDQAGVKPTIQTEKRLLASSAKQHEIVGLRTATLWLAGQWVLHWHAGHAGHAVQPGTMTRKCESSSLARLRSCRVALTPSLFALSP